MDAGRRRKRRKTGRTRRRQDHQTGLRVEEEEGGIGEFEGKHPKGQRRRDAPIGRKDEEDEERRGFWWMKEKPKCAGGEKGWGIGKSSRLVG
jgi:hypothetical protein